jgi:hypothetical protein
MAQPPHTRAEMRAFYPVCQVTELAAGYRYTTIHGRSIIMYEYGMLRGHGRSHASPLRARYSSDQSLKKGLPYAQRNAYLQPIVL